MPQVDLICGGDPKVACETTLIGSQPDPHKSEADPDFPPESISIPLDIDHWPVDTYPIIYDRDDSTKGTTNPKSHNHHNNQNDHDHHSSRRFSGNLKATTKAPIIALPNTIQQQSGYLGRSARRRPVYRVRNSDPGSPEVSCFGKVLSQREKSTRNGGCWAALLGCFGGRRVAPPPARKRNIPGRGTDILAGERDVPAVVPGLGGMKRFVSGRRMGPWGDDLDEDGHAAWSGPLDR